MSFEKFPKIARLNREMIITEKIDGTNGQVFITDAPIPSYSDFIIGERDSLYMYAGSRKRWCKPDKGYDNHGFARWVYENQDTLWELGPGRHFGEWYGQGIGRKYGLDHRRWALFNVSRWEMDWPGCCEVVPTLLRGDFDTAHIRRAMYELRKTGSIAVPGFMNPEGVVVYHTQGNVLFKATLEGDDKGKEYGG